MRTQLLSLAIFATCLAACGSPPDVPGFTSGGLLGALCPPASTPDGSCDVGDCSVDCVATTPCDPASPKCPAGTACDVGGDDYCMPITCLTACSNGYYCATKRYSHGVCLPVDATPASCDSALCAFPFECVEGACKLRCESTECPAGMVCSDGYCAAG